MPGVLPILANMATSISEFKKKPMAVIHQGGGGSVAVLNCNKPAFYCIPSDIREALLDQLEDIELARLVEERKNQKEIPVSLNDL